MIFTLFHLSPRFAHYQRHVLHVRHVHPRLSVYDVATQFLHRVFQLAEIGFMSTMIHSRGIERKGLVHLRQIFYQPQHFLPVEVFLAAQSNLLRVPGCVSA